MYAIELLEYDSNNHLANVELVAVPRVGEYMIMDNQINKDWEEKFYLVRAVTYTLGSGIHVHIEKQDLKEIRSRENTINSVMDRLNKKAKEMGLG